MDYINWFSIAETALNTWDKSCSVLMYNYFYILLDLICYYVVDSFCSYVQETFQFVFFSCNAFSGVGIRAVLPSKNQGVLPLYLLKEVVENQYNFFINCLEKFTVSLSGYCTFCIGRILTIGSIFLNRYKCIQIICFFLYKSWQIVSFDLNSSFSSFVSLLLIILFHLYIRKHAYIRIHH